MAHEADGRLERHVPDMSSPVSYGGGAVTLTFFASQSAVIDLVRMKSIWLCPLPCPAELLY